MTATISDILLRVSCSFCKDSSNWREAVFRNRPPISVESCTRLLRHGAALGLWFSSKTFTLCCREKAFGFDVTVVCFLSVTDSPVAAMISCPMKNRRRSDNMDNNLFIMANFKILSYKSNNAVGKKLRNFLKKLDKDVVCSLNLYCQNVTGIAGIWG